MNQAAPGFQLERWQADRRPAVERALEAALGSLEAGTQPTLFQAMRYSLLAGGKRLRPLLALAAAEAVGHTFSGTVRDFACALELVHTYSLIHDDLPAMDDDALRRGKPTNHMVYGEAMAILAGDALLTEAFALLAGGAEPVRRALVRLLADAAGARGMVGGQADDIREDRPREREFLDRLHARKTGALIAAAAAGGALAAGAGPDVVDRLTRYGEHLGLAFQIHDDVLDVKGDPVSLGKSTGLDARNAKVTYPSLLGLDEAVAAARNASQLAVAEAERLGAAAAPLRALAIFAVERDR